MSATDNCAHGSEFQYLKQNLQRLVKIMKYLTTFHEHGLFGLARQKMDAEGLLLAVSQNIHLMKEQIGSYLEQISIPRLSEKEAFLKKQEEEMEDILNCLFNGNTSRLSGYAITNSQMVRSRVELLSATAKEIGDVQGEIFHLTQINDLIDILEDLTFSVSLICSWDRSCNYHGDPSALFARRWVESCTDLPSNSSNDLRLSPVPLNLSSLSLNILINDTTTTSTEDSNSPARLVSSISMNVCVNDPSKLAPGYSSTSTSRSSPSSLVERTTVRSVSRGVSFQARRLADRSRDVLVIAREPSASVDSPRKTGEAARVDQKPRTSSSTSARKQKKESSPEFDSLSAARKPEADSSPGRKPEFDSSPGKPEFDSSGRKPEFESSPRKPEFESSPRKPEFESSPRKPEFDSSQKKTEADSSQKKSESDISSRKPEFDSSSRKPEFDSSGRKPEFDSSSRKPEFDSSSRKPEFDSSGRKPEIDSSSRKQEIDSSARKPEIDSSARKPEIVSASPKRLSDLSEPQSRLYSSMAQSFRDPSEDKSRSESTSAPKSHSESTSEKSPFELLAGEPYFNLLDTGKQQHESPSRKPPHEIVNNDSGFQRSASSEFDRSMPSTSLDNSSKAKTNSRTGNSQISDSPAKSGFEKTAAAAAAAAPSPQTEITRKGSLAESITDAIESFFPASSFFQSKSAKEQNKPSPTHSFKSMDSHSSSDRASRQASPSHSFKSLVDEQTSQPKESGSKHSFHSAESESKHSFRTAQSGSSPTASGTSSRTSFKSVATTSNGADGVTFEKRFRQTSAPSPSGRKSYVEGQQQLQAAYDPVSNVFTATENVSYTMSMEVDQTVNWAGRMYDIFHDRFRTPFVMIDNVQASARSVFKTCFACVLVFLTFLAFVLLLSGLTEVNAIDCIALERALSVWIEVNCRGETTH